MKFIKSPLEAALDEAVETHWRGRRTLATSVCQAQKAIATIQDIAGENVTLKKVTPAVLKEAIGVWRQSVKPITINARLSVLSTMGVDVTGCRVRVARKEKWWLSGPEEAQLLAYLRGPGAATNEHFAILADLIHFTTRSGLRIEESLRLNWVHVDLAMDGQGGYLPGKSTVTVPGSKTMRSQASLPLSEDAAMLLWCLRENAIAASATMPRGAIFGPWPNTTAAEVQRTYNRLGAAWRQARLYLGLSDPGSATLKALRRSAARHLTVNKGMPLDMLRQYLRHGNIATTMGYLHLTGGYATEELRRWM